MISRGKIKNFHLNMLKGLDHIFLQYPDIYSVYLFGSYAAGNQTPLSDIDICYFSKKEIDHHIESDIGESVRSHLMTDEVDFVSFYKLPLRTQYDIFKQGKLLYLKNEKELCNTREKVIRDYLDFIYYFEEYDRSFKESLAEGAFFHDT